MNTKEHAETATRLKKLIDSISDLVDKVPSYSGKARLMDKVIKAMHLSQSLHANLQDDLASEDQN